MPDDSPILEFVSAATLPDPWYDVWATDLSLTLAKGELGLFRFDHHSPRLPLPDMSMGLVDLKSGDVRFLGKSWADLSANEAADRRGLIGRLFNATGWVHHLDVDENITLRLRHHTNRSAREIEQEAADLAAAFGLKHGLPRTRPGNLGLHDMQRAACVRMLLGSPPLIVIDEDASGFFPDILAVLIKQIQQARAVGAAVLWLTADLAVLQSDSLQPTFSQEFAEMALASRHISAPIRLE